MKELIEFLELLKLNNNREWFQANKTIYEKVKNDFMFFTGKLISGISKFDADIKNISPKDCMFRIYRDVRFSNDKSPYKTNFGAFIAPGGLKSQLPGYYFHVQRGECFTSAGIYMPGTDVLNKIRLLIVNEYSEFKSIIESSNFKKYKLNFWEDKLKRPPKGFDADFEGIEYVKLKSFVPYYEISEQELFSGNLIENILEKLKIMYPFNRFLKKAFN